jgi:hypothetical protein
MANDLDALLKTPDPEVDLHVPPPTGGGRIVFAGSVYNGNDSVEKLLPEGWTGRQIHDNMFISGRYRYRLWFETADRFPRLIQRRYEKWFLARCAEFPPHLVIVKRGTFFSARLIEALHDQGARVMNVNNDAWDSKIGRAHV